MADLFAGLYTILLILCLGLNLFGLPGNWAIIGLFAIWKWMHPEIATWLFFVFLSVLGLVGEGIEFGASVWGAKKYGGTSKGNMGAMVGAILGSIVLAPFLFGFGALVGAFAGAYIGCFLLEKLQGRTTLEAKKAALGAMWGKVFGVVAKLGIGIGMLSLIVPRMWG